MNADRNEVNKAGAVVITCAPFASFPAKIDEKICLNGSIYITLTLKQYPSSNGENVEKNEAK